MGSFPEQQRVISSLHTRTRKLHLRSDEHPFEHGGLAGKEFYQDLLVLL